MKREITLIALVLCIGCETTAPSLVNVNPRIAEFQIRRVAILPFEALPNEKDTEEFSGFWKFNILNNGEVASDIFTTEMMSIPTFSYLERSQIRRILEEEQLSLTDLIKDKTASEIGQLLGVDAVIIGKVNQLHAASGGWWCGCRASFSVRMVETKSGTVLWSATADRCEGGHGETLKLLRDECSKIVNELKAKLEPEAPTAPAVGKN